MAIMSETVAELCAVINIFCRLLEMVSDVISGTFVRHIVLGNATNLVVLGCTVTEIFKLSWV